MHFAFYYFSLILVNEFEKPSFQVSTFANGSLKENFLGIDFRQNLRNSGKLVQQRICF